MVSNMTKIFKNNGSIIKIYCVVIKVMIFTFKNKTKTNILYSETLIYNIF